MSRDFFGIFEGIEETDARDRMAVCRFRECVNPANPEDDSPELQKQRATLPLNIASRLKRGTWYRVKITEDEFNVS